MISKLTALSSSLALALAFAASSNVQAFSIDLAPVAGGAGPGFADFSPVDGDRIFNTTVPITNLQLNIPVNTIIISGFDFTGSVGDSFSFTDQGTANFTTPLPTPQAGFDAEGYNSIGGFEMLGVFDFLGTATITAINASLGQVSFDFTFNSGVLDVFYDETVDGLLTAGSENVLAATLTSGGGNADQTVGSATQNAGSYVADFVVNDLLDGYWLDDAGNPFLDGMTVAFTDGNINQTQASWDGDTTLTVLANSDGSFRVAAIPEPASLALMGLGLLGMGGMARRKRT